MPFAHNYLFEHTKLLFSEDLNLSHFRIRILIWVLEVLACGFTPVLIRNSTFLKIALLIISQAFYLMFLFRQKKNSFLIGLCYIITRISAWAVFFQGKENLLSVYLYSSGSLALYFVQGFPCALNYLYTIILFVMVKCNPVPRYQDHIETYYVSPKSLENLVDAWPITFIISTVCLYLIQIRFDQVWRKYKEAQYKLEDISNQLDQARTQIKKQTDQTDSLRQQLKHALKSQDLFLSSVSHELRNPLNVLLGNIDILQSQIKNNFVEIFKSCKICGEVILSHINNFLDVAKINSERLEITPFPTQVSSFLEKFWTSVGNDIKRKKLFGLLMIDRNFPPWIEIDNHRLQQVLYNLVNNSVKFTSQGSIRISFTWVNDQKVFNRLTSSEDSSDDSLSDGKETLGDRTDEGKAAADIREALFNQNNIQHLNNSLFFTIDSPIEPILGPSLRNSKLEHGIMRIDVFDSGCGIPKGFHEKLFQAFAQGDVSLTRQHSGTGLGLYIVKKIVEKMKGELQVNSVENVGTHFKVLLPTRTVASQSQEEQSRVRKIIHGRNESYGSFLSDLNNSFLSEKEVNDLKRVNSLRVQDKKVLIVDDIGFNQKILQNFFGSLGFETEFADNGLFAVHTYKENPEKYFLITMDIQMPVMDGITACQRIRSYERESNLKEIPIVVITGNSLTKKQNEFLKSKEINVTYFFRKPFRLADCKLCIQKILEESYTPAR